jgi:hypothetical protein
MAKGKSGAQNPGGTIVTAIKGQPVAPIGVPAQKPLGMQDLINMVVPNDGVPAISGKK